MASAPQNPTVAGGALRVADLPGRGRALIAARNVREGEVLLAEPALLLYPASLASLPSFCSACFRSLPSSPPHAPCPSCRAAAFCSPACAAASHPRLLCAALSGGSLAAAPEALHEPLLFLLSAYSLQEPSFRALLSLSSAPQGPSPSQQDAASVHAMVAALAPSHMLPPGFSPDLTVALLAKDRTNSFSIMEPYSPEVPQELRKARACAVYPRASLLNHDCLPNACHFDYTDRSGPRNTDIVVRALHDITEGREVCISYFAANWRYADRQRRLLEDYGFRCECERCQVESQWKLDDDNDGGDGDDTMEEEQGEEDGGDDGMEQEEGDGGGDDGEDDFPHAYFFVRYLCDREGCCGMLAPLPPLPNGELSHVFECNVCGQLRKEEDDDAHDGGATSMVH